MRKTSLFLVFGLFIAFTLHVRCSGKKETVESDTKPVHIDEPVVENTDDTIWKKEVRYDFYSNHNFERIFSDTINGELFTVRLISRDKNEEYVGVTSYNEDGKIYATKHIGKNSVFTFKLYDSNDNVVTQKRFDRYDLEKYISKDLLAGSVGAFWNFEGYFDTFDRFCFTTYWMFEESDVGEKYVVFLDPKLEIKDFFFDSFTGGGACQCDENPSMDEKTFAFCSRIYRSNGNHTILGKNDQKVTGSFVLNKDYCLVINNYEGKPPYSNAHIIDNRGVVRKKFDYTGITAAMGYVISIFKVNDQAAVFLLDQEKRSLYRIDLNDPLQIDLIKIDGMEKMQEGEVLNKNMPDYLEVSSETKTFFFEYKNQKFRYYGESEDW